MPSPLRGHIEPPPPVAPPQQPEPDPPPVGDPPPAPELPPPVEPPAPHPPAVFAHPAGREQGHHRGESGRPPSVGMQLAIRNFPAMPCAARPP